MNKSLKIATFVFFDIISVAVAWVLAIYISAEAADKTAIFSGNWYFIIIDAAIAILVNALLKLYVSILRYAGLAEAIRIFIAALCFAAVNAVIAVFKNDLGVSWAVIMSLFYLLFLFVSRFSYKGYLYVTGKKKRQVKYQNRMKVMIIGGGAAGAMLVNEMKTTDKVNMLPVCILDDDINKKGQSINGVKIVGTTDDVEKFAKAYEPEEIIIALPSASKDEKAKIITKCQATGCKIMTIPGVYQLAEGDVSVTSIKEVSIQDLLGREQVKVNLDEIMGYIEGKCVLVTGGGGSIGSELCRQIAKHNPSKLIVFDIYENNAYDIQQELLRKYPNLNLLALIGSVRDSRKLDNLFNAHRPDIVFHAAAHKHVPLMETSPNEAVKNNVSGTLKLATAAGKYKAERFILISTDKAVNPTNIMGATKRICEMIIQAMNNKFSETNYVAVRFGNVLGSNGSVIPLFAKQIKEGGPVTVTDKNIVRYFMTIPEAVSLVLQAGAYAKGGEIFVLDMGEPVKIVDLAENMIRLSGFEPYKDIDIKFTGLRPGEKLYEERLMQEEGLEKTANDMISIGKPIVFDEENLFNKIQELYEESYKETDRMKELVHDLVPTYKIDKR